VLCAAATALSVPAAAYVPPATAILKRTAQHRQELRLTSLEVRGTISFSGPAAERMLASSTAAPGAPLRAAVLVKVPGRCRLELAPEGTPAPQRPAVTVRAGRVSGVRGLQDVGAARALAEAVCALLADRITAGEPERDLAQRLAERGVDLQAVTIGRYNGRVVWIIGGGPHDERPQVWIDKQTFQPVRLIGPVAGAVQDVRFVDPGVPAERFPRTIEVWSQGQLEARFSAEAVTANPRLPDSAFP